MTILHKLASAQDRGDELPNQELAQDLALSQDRQAIQELVENLANKDAAIQSDCIKVLYELGERAPSLIADYSDHFVKLLQNKQNRLVWGGMSALATLASLRADALMPHVPAIQAAMRQGSVIIIDNGVKTLARIAAQQPSYNHEIFPYLLQHLQHCRAKEIPQHSESISAALTAENKQDFLDLLDARFAELSSSQAARVKKVMADARKRLFFPRRQLGRTGFVASLLGSGDLADRQLSLKTCVATLRRAIDAGLNVIDTAPGYEDGFSEQIVGEAVKPYPRQSLFVISKIDALDAPVASQLDQSLARLQLDFVDGYVFHGLSSMERFQQLAQPGGGFDQLKACIHAGKARFAGISSHNPDVLRAAITAGLCEIVMFPIGAFVEQRYVDEILPLAKERGVGTICFKTFGAGKLLGDTIGYNQPLQLRPRGKLSSGGSDETQAVLPRLTVSECLHYTLTIDPDVALLGLSYPNEQDTAFVAAQSFQPLTAEQMAKIRRKAAEARKDKGPCWWNPNPDL